VAEIAEMAGDSERMRLALRHSGIGVYEWDLERQTVYLSPEYYRLLGYEPYEFPTSPDAWRERVHRQDMSVLEGLVAQYLGGYRTSHDLLYRMRAKSGEWRWVESRGGLPGDGSLRILGVHLDAQDAATKDRQLRSAEDRLRRFARPRLRQCVRPRSARLTRDNGGTENLLRQAIDQSPVSIVITDTQGRIKFVNPRFEKSTGWMFDECLDQRVSFLKSGHQPPEIYRDLWETISSGREWNGEFCNKRRSGELFWESAVVAPLRNSQGRITNYVAVKTDITELHEARVERERLNVELEQRRRLAAVGHAVSETAHCLRNILTSLVGAGQTLDTALGLQEWGNAKASAGIMNRSARRLNPLVQEMLEHSKERLACPEPVDVRDLLEEARDEVLGLPCGQPVEIVVEADPRVGSWPLDHFLVQRALINLGCNALDAMPKGGRIIFRSRWLDDMCEPWTQRGEFVELTSPPYLLLEVDDSGVGIAPEALPRIFDSYFTTKGSRGTGLGLANVSQTMQVHHGAVAVDSVLGEGSVFRLVFPGESVRPPGHDASGSVAKDAAD